MFPFDPEAHTFLDARRLASLGGLRQLIEADAQTVRSSSSIGSLAQSYNDAVPLPQPEAKKRPSKRLSTENGCLLTAEAVLAQLEAKAADAERAAAEKTANKRTRAARKDARAGAAAAKTAEREAAAAARERAGAEIEAALALAKAAADERARAENSRQSSADATPAVQPWAVVAAVLVSRGAGPEIVKATQRKWEQRRAEQAERAEVKERAVASVAAAREAAAAVAAASAVEAERPALPLGDVSNVTVRGQKRKATAEAEAGKENGHEHNTRTKAARAQGVQRGLGAVLSVSR